MCAQRSNYQNYEFCSSASIFLSEFYFNVSIWNWRMWQFLKNVMTLVFGPTAVIVLRLQKFYPPLLLYLKIQYKRQIVSLRCFKIHLYYILSSFFNCSQWEDWHLFSSFSLLEAWFIIFNLFFSLYFGYVFFLSVCCVLYWFLFSGWITWAF